MTAAMAEESPAGLAALSRAPTGSSRPARSVGVTPAVPSQRGALSRAPRPQIPAPQIPAPQIPAPQIPAPQIPAPQIPGPRVPVRQGPGRGSDGTAHPCRDLG
ncbi:hypothetical protein GCM10010434_036950 [Winogradskya humida]